MKFIKTNARSLLPILFVLVIIAYSTVIILKFPLVGLEVKLNNNHWVVEKIYDKGWASSQSIMEGDILELINGKKPEHHTTVVLFNRVEMANSITILDQNLNIDTLSISYANIKTQYLIYLILPFVFTFMTVLLSIFLYRRKKHDQSAVILIYFLLSIDVSYLSASVSARGDILGRVVNTITLPGSLILFVHFIKSYLLRFNLVFIKTKSLIIWYSLYFIVISLMVSSLIFYKQNFHIINIQLFFFLLLIGYFIFHSIRFYFKYKKSEGNNVLIILGLTLLSALLPFVSLYAFPNIFFEKEIVPAETTAIFLIIIPIVFVYLQLSEKLFDIEFLLSRLRYYSLLSFPFTISIVILISLILKTKLLSSKTLIIFFLLFACTTLFLYMKEYLDYNIRHHLFSQKGNFEASLYTFFQKAMHETKVSSLIITLMNEIREVLKVSSVLYIEMFTEIAEEKWILKNVDNYPLSFKEGLEAIKWDNHRTGSVIEVLDGFGIIIAKDNKYINIIYCGMKKSRATLNIQERVWIETLSYFSSILLENFQLIEGLFEKIENYKGEKQLENDNYPSWLSRLLFSLSEKERANLSIDLHDSVLQDQLQLLREVEKIKSKVKDIAIKNDLTDLNERILDNIHLIRETCNELRPPFLNELGIIQSIQNLIEQTKLRCDFILKSELDQSIQNLDKECELTLYRVVQELLNNASKHSLASEVKVSLRKNNDLLSLIYSDNGKGIDLTKLKDSFKTIGLFGIKERVKSIGGTIDIESAPGKGTQMFIEIKIGGTEFD